MKYFVFLTVMLAAGLPGCSVRPRPLEQQARVCHVIIMWLKEPGNDAARSKMVASSHKFSYIPGVLNVYAGRILPGNRPVVDNSFDVAVVMTFADEAALAGYLEHPVHKKEIKEALEPLVDRILVYDFTIETAND